MAAAASSDYGSDLDSDAEEAVDAFLSALDVNNPIAPPQGFKLESLVEEDDRERGLVRLPRSSPAGTAGDLRGSQVLGPHNPEGVGGEQDQIHTLARVRECEQVTSNDDAQDTSDLSVGSEAALAQDETKSPLERFRTAPKKPLSVTDIVSPAWCELQYEYTLAKFGKKKRTPAMRQGSAVHRALEEQVHTLVPVTVQTREDRWGLRIWNVIQGLRTLRLTGMTRELEIWGVVDGQVVNGVIDEVSYTCPSPQLEAELEAKKAARSGRTPLPPTQQTLDEFFGSQRIDSDTLQSLDSATPQSRSSDRKMYLTDVKTRSRASIPSRAAMRPTFMQLMLYRALFVSLATNNVPAHVIFERHSLDPNAQFSDDFISQVSSLDVVGAFESNRASQDEKSPLQELQQHNCLSLLWQLMIQAFALTIPSPANVGDVLCARYVHAETQEEIGSKCFPFDAEQLDRYLADGMQWWKGERPARGVDVEEAYKCQMCEFADGCTWREGKVAEAVEKSRYRRARVASREAG